MIDNCPEELEEELVHYVSHCLEAQGACYCCLEAEGSLLEV